VDNSIYARVLNTQPGFFGVATVKTRRLRETVCLRAYPGEVAAKFHGFGCDNSKVTKTFTLFFRFYNIQIAADKDHMHGWSERLIEV
jgi:hypothetical protein